MTNLSARTFSNQRHAEGWWNTRAASLHPLIRPLWDFISFKRKGVSDLARRCGGRTRGIDIGCGNGAYARWFTRKRRCTIVGLDWSFHALSTMKTETGARILRVCADARMMPFRSHSFDFFFTVDVLGHIENADRALDEALRVTRPGSPLFIHSECGDYRRRWPDKALIKKLGVDYPAQIDGHWGLRTSAAIYSSLISRFRITSFFSPAGLAGWLLGYPEKYAGAFRAAAMPVLAALAGIFAVIKRAPVLGAALRFINALSNYAELFFGITGGGSCFAYGRTPHADDAPAPHKE